MDKELEKDNQDHRMKDIPEYACLRFAVVGD